MKRILNGLVALLLLGTTGAAADLSVDQVIEKYIAASGGYAKLKGLQSLKATGIYSAGEAPIPFVIFRKRPNLYRWDRDIKGQLLILSYDGQTAWWINPFSETGVSGPAKMPEADAKNLQGEAMFEDELIDYKKKGNRVELLGTDDVDGQEAYKLKVTRKDGGVERYFINTDNFLKLKQSSVFKANNREFELLTYYQNYKAVNGVLLPFRIEREFAGQHRVIDVKAIELNPKLDEASFHMPKGK